MAAELRPAHLDDWLDTLPYANPGKSLELILAALVETRAAHLKSSVRFELLDLYWLRYRFLLHVTVRPEPGRPSLAPAQRPLLLPKLRNVALELGHGCAQTLRDAGVPTRNLATTLFRVGQRQGRTSLLGITAHAHALLLGFESYLPATEDAWRELHGIFSLAESGMYLDEQLPDPDQPDRKTTSRQAYARICAYVLAQPSQLDPGAIWQAYDLLADWNQDIELSNYQPPIDPRGVFVIDPTRTPAPIDLRKVDPTAPTPRWLMLRCSRLAQRCNVELGRMAGQTGASILDQQRARTRLLEHLARLWGDAPRRRQPRRAAAGSVRIVSGIRDVHALFEAGGIGAAAGDSEQSWQLLNSSEAGAALVTASATAAPRIGELLAVRLGGSERWAAAVIRWLRLEPTGSYSVGTQIISRSVRAALLHAVTGSEFQTQPRPALLLAAEGDQPEILLAAPGLYAPGQRLQLTIGGQRQEVTADRVVERSATFDRFCYTN